MSVFVDNRIDEVSLTKRLSKRHTLQRHHYALDSEAIGHDYFKTDNLTNEGSINEGSTNEGLLSRIDNSKPIDDIQVYDSIDSLVIEAAVSIVINGIHYAVLMASPSQLEYLALGFLFSEGLIEHNRDLLDWNISHIEDADSIVDFEATNTYAKDSTSTDFYKDSLDTEQLIAQLQDYDVYIVELTLNQRCHQRILAQKRQLAGRTGCGMCGMTGLVQALPDLSAYKKMPTAAPSLTDLLTLREQVTQAQRTHQMTGAVHAAAASYQGKLQLFEDVGRHNALDKLIGWQLRHNSKLDCVIMTSRLSIELVQKSIRAPIPWLIGMSAPTSTAVTVAKRYGLGLGGFLRENRVSFYTHYPRSEK